MVKTRYFYQNFQSLFSANFGDDIKISFFTGFIFNGINKLAENRDVLQWHFFNKFALCILEIKMGTTDTAAELKKYNQKG